MGDPKFNYILTSEKDKDKKEVQTAQKETKVLNLGAPIEQALMNGLDGIIKTFPQITTEDDTLEVAVGEIMGPNGKRFQLKLQATAYEDIFLPHGAVGVYRYAPDEKKKNEPATFNPPHAQA